MASGRTHALTSLVAAVPCGIAVGWLTADIGAGVAATVGCASGIALSPDADIAGLTEGETWVIHKLPVIGWLWAGYWWVYGKLLPHRGISHWPIAGTATRLLYLAIPLLILAWRFQLSFWPLPPLAWAWAAGLAWSDVLHWIGDGCPL